MDSEIAFPFRVDGQGRINRTRDPLQRGKQHLLTYLLTRRGERVMRSEFGTPLRDYVFENLDPIRFTLINQQVVEAVRKDVTDVTLRNVSATEDSATASLLLNVQFALAVGAGLGDHTVSINTGGIST